MTLVENFEFAIMQYRDGRIGDEELNTHRQNLNNILENIVTKPINYQLHSDITCQTFGPGTSVPCAECNQTLVDVQELAELRARAAARGDVKKLK